MKEHAYSRRELAHDLYEQADELVRDLVKFRKQRGLTQSDLAELVGVTQSYISQIETGRKSLTGFMTDLALELGIRIRYDVEAAEEHPDGMRAIVKESGQKALPYLAERLDGEPSVGEIKTSWSIELPRDDKFAKLNLVEPASSSDSEGQVTNFEGTLSTSRPLEPVNA